MFFKVLVLNIILSLSIVAVQSGYYTKSKVGNTEIYFPKSDTEYIDYLTQREDSPDYYEMAIIHMKLGKRESAERYIELYSKEKDNLKRMLNYYRLAGDYQKIEKYLDLLLEESDEDSKVKYRIWAEETAAAEGNLTGWEKYRVDKVERLYFYRDDDEMFREYFNSEKWTKSEMKRLVEKLKSHPAKGGEATEKLFGIFATERDKIQRRYLEIKGIEDFEGYRSYFTYAGELGLEAEIKDELEGLYYLRYKDLQGEAKKYQQKLLLKYIEEKNTERVKLLHRFDPTEEAKGYLVKVDEDTAYSFFLERSGTEAGREYLKRFPEGEYAEKVYTRTFKMASDTERKELIEKYDRGYEVSKDFLLKTYTPEEKVKLLKVKVGRGELGYLDEYVKALQTGGKDVENALKNISLEAYTAYLVDQRKSLSEGEKKMAAQYLYEIGDIERLRVFKSYLSKEKVAELSQKDTVFRKYYRERYPLERENIDTSDEKYFYFASKPVIDIETVEELLQKRHLEPHERYYLAIYYYNKKDFPRSYRETERLYKRYRLSDRIGQLHTSNIDKIKGLTDQRQSSSVVEDTSTGNTE